jgi:hypothetical protein
VTPDSRNARSFDESSADDADDTAANITDSPRHAVAVWLRRFGLLVLAVVVVLGGIGALGVKSHSVSASGGGYSLRVDYPRIGRAGLDVPWRATVVHPGGFSKPVTLAVTTSYFDIFETQGFHPDPESETGDPHFVYLTFSPPKGDTLTVSYDTYIQPAAQQSHSAVTAVIVDNTPVVSVHYRTLLFP